MKRFQARGAFFQSMGWFVALLLGTTPALAQRGPDSQLLFELLNRIERLEREVRQLRGEVEVYRYRQEELQRQFEAAARAPAEMPRFTDEPAADEMPLMIEPDSSGEIPSEPPAEFSSARPGERPFLGDEEPPFAAPPPAVPRSSAAASPSAQAAYDVALSRLREGRYEQAITGFHEFLRAYSDSPLAANAQYWLGETYYVNRDFDKAREAFVTMGINYPNSRRLPDALLKLGYVYDELGDTAKAREVLQKLIEVYPDSSAAGLARNRLQAIR